MVYRKIVTASRGGAGGILGIGLWVGFHGFVADVSTGFTARFVVDTYELFTPACGFAHLLYPASLLNCEEPPRSLFPRGHDATPFKSALLGTIHHRM